MRVKIKGGTARHDEPSLCLTCRFATIVRGQALRDEIIECSQLAASRKSITFPVVSCSDYSDKRRPSLREMEEIAWVLTSDPRRNEIGFVRASALKPRDRFILDDDWV
jgi:hypothetical protein